MLLHIIMRNVQQQKTSVILFLYIRSAAGDSRSSSVSRSVPRTDSHALLIDMVFSACLPNNVVYGTNGRRKSPCVDLQRASTQPTMAQLLIYSQCFGLRSQNYLYIRFTGTSSHPNTMLSLMYEYITVLQIKIFHRLITF